MKLLFGLIFLVGFAYRYILGSRTEQHLVWDQVVYVEMAERLLSGQFAADCCTHGPGYSLFLALIFFLFGKGNLLAVRLVQAALDTLTGLIIFAVTRRLFTQKIAIVSLLLYLINPFTSSYTGLILAETVGSFLISLIAYMMSLSHLLTKRFALIVFAFLLSYVGVTKYAFFYASILGLCIVIVILLRRRLFRECMFFIVTACIVFAYPLMANVAVFGAYTVMPPYSDTTSLFYASLFMGRYPELYSEFGKVSPEYAKVMEEYYHVAQYDTHAFPNFRSTHKALLFEKLKTDRTAIISHVLQNNIWMWDKPYRTVYIDPLYPKWKRVFQGYNLASLLLAVVGLWSAIHRKKSMYILLVTLFVLFYISGGLSLLTNETRVTIIFYPLLFLWAGVGLAYVLTKVHIHL